MVSIPEMSLIEPVFTFSFASAMLSVPSSMAAAAASISSVCKDLRMMVPPFPKILLLYARG